MSIEDITIVITSFKSDDKINSCLDSVNSKAKVIVVENSGSQKFKEYIENNYQNVECIIPNENLGYAKGNNLGLSKVDTKYALVLNPDTVLQEKALENCLTTASQYPDFSLIGPFSDQGKETKNKKELTQVKNLKGFAIFFNMKKFKKNKFFDENYFLYFEEIDLCRSVTKDKGKIYLDPKISILHEGAKSVNKIYSFEIEKNRNWHWMWSTFYYHKKHRNFFYAILITLPKLFSAFFKTVFYGLILDKSKRDIYYCRLSGLINSILGKNSWHRPSLD